jgi:hypothetical protein
MKKLIQLLVVLLVSAYFAQAFAVAEDFAAAVTAGKVSVTFRGNGGSSGDAIEAMVVNIPKAAADRELPTTDHARAEFKLGSFPQDHHAPPAAPSPKLPVTPNQ